MCSDVCKHCTHAACLDVCPTGSLFRTEFGTVVVQEDICNGCGYCVPACPFGVLDQRTIPSTPNVGHKPDLPAIGPHERASGGRPRLEVHALLRPAQGRPRAGVREGLPDELDPVRPARRAARARRRRGSRSSTADGWNGAQLYGRDPDDGVGGFGAFFLLLDEPEVYGLPPDPVVTTPTSARCGNMSRRRRGGGIGVVGGRALGAFARSGRRHERRSTDEVRTALLLRPAGDQGAGLDVGDPDVLLHGRARGRVLRARPAREAAGNARLARAALYVGAAADVGVARCCSSPISAGPSGSTTCSASSR